MITYKSHYDCGEKIKKDLRFLLGLAGMRAHCYWLAVFLCDLS